MIEHGNSKTKIAEQLGKIQVKISNTRYRPVFQSAACDDTCSGALLDEIEQMFDWLNHIDINELLKAPWYNLLRLNDSLRRTKNVMEEYKYQILEAEGILRESLFSINMESRISAISFQLHNKFTQTIPKIRERLDDYRDDNRRQRVDIEDEYKRTQGIDIFTRFIYISLLLICEFKCMPSLVV